MNNKKLLNGNTNYDKVFLLKDFISLIMSVRFVVFFYLLNARNIYWYLYKQSDASMNLTFCMQVSRPISFSNAI